MATLASASTAVSPQISSCHRSSSCHAKLHLPPSDIRAMERFLRSLKEEAPASGTKTAMGLLLHHSGIAAT
ncbi:hypothetical protein Y032_0032g2593 [Ancylostoma ceylanicum]|uniref:Uncharacterized protein n=1 Tax=Ancylostoma ceylanicum TaxID=53326 RepID=A0A016UPX0_9BILA|nr:hypothetical protein Y032_0032g2593 [Ancylostoma ceylanicum]